MRGARRPARWYRPRPPRSQFPPRRLDVLTAAAECVLLTAALVGVLCSLALGVRVSHAVADQANAQSHDRIAVPAVITHINGLPDPDSRSSYPVSVAIRWTGRDGLNRVGTTQVRGQPSPGDTVTAWVDRTTNRIVPAPKTMADALFAALGIWLFTLTGLGAAVGICWAGLRRCSLAAACAAWEREWATIEPIWTGRRETR
jgi:hypothetical protein